MAVTEQKEAVETRGASFLEEAGYAAPVTLVEQFNAIDWATMAYLGITGFAVLVFHANLDNWYRFIVVRTVIASALLVMIKFSPLAAIHGLRVLRYWYPALLFPYFYTETGSLNQMVLQGYWDPFFAEIDLFIFGTHPNLWLYDRLNDFTFNEIIHFCYFSYYFIATLLGVVLYLRRDIAFARSFFGISVGFYACYLLYMFIPVVGPLHYREDRFLDGGLFVQIMDWIYANAEKPGAAFPSSHVAIASMTLLYAFKSHRPTFWVFLPLVLGLIFSTIYGFYHYVIDVIAGLVVGYVFFRVCNRWFDRRFRDQFSPLFD
jgi:membrane-associated phospholipid phosphatase